MWSWCELLHQSCVKAPLNQRVQCDDEKWFAIMISAKGVPQMQTGESWIFKMAEM